MHCKLEDRSGRLMGKADPEPSPIVSSGPGQSVSNVEVGAVSTGVCGGSQRVT